MNEISPPRLELAGVAKRFPGVIANEDVALTVAPGEIHALLGENGAGKSTLVKMIFGVMRPDAGWMKLDGEDYAPARPSEARARGVGMVFQHFSLFEAMTVAENVALGMNARDVGRDLDRQIVEVSQAYGLDLDPKRLVGALSAGERQRVEIVRCLLQKPRLLIMDEPTSVLTPQEAERLFETLRRLADEGCSVLYISHKLEEIRAHCDKATVLRRGRLVGVTDPRAASARQLAEMMIGAELAEARVRSADVGDVRLRCSSLSLANDDPFGVDLKDMSFEVRAGEIMGIGGIAGNGQTELLAALIGERRTPPGAIRLDGKDIGPLGPTARRRRGLVAVPEERLGHSAVPGMTLVENAILSARARTGMERGGFLRLGRASAFAKRVVDLFDVRTAGVEHEADSLSGGNLQRFIVGRELLQEPSVLAVLQPTWGVDAAAAAAIHAAIREMAAKGGAVLVISQDLDELMAVSTRFAVISEGRVSAPKPTSEVTVEEIGLMMGAAA